MLSQLQQQCAQFSPQDYLNTLHLLNNAAAAEGGAAAVVAAAAAAAAAAGGGVQPLQSHSSMSELAAALVHDTRLAVSRHIERTKTRSIRSQNAAATSDAPTSSAKKTRRRAAAAAAAS